MSGADDAARGPREDRVHRRRSCLVRRHRPAAGAHDQKAAFETPIAHLRFEPVEVSLHERPDVGIQHGGARAFVFAVLTNDLGRDRDLEVGEHLTHRFGGEALMRVAAIRVEKDDRYRLDAVRDELPCSISHGLDVERLELAT